MEKRKCKFLNADSSGRGADQPQAQSVTRDSFYWRDGMDDWKSVTSFSR